MRNLWDYRYANYTDMITIRCMHVSKYHSVFHKYVVIICQQKKKILYLPFSFSLFHKDTVEFFRDYMIWNTAINWMQKQIWAPVFYFKRYWKDLQKCKTVLFSSKNVCF